MPYYFSLHLMILGRTQDFMWPITNQPLCMVKKKIKKRNFYYLAHFLLLALIFSRFSKCSASLTDRSAEAEGAAAGPRCQRAPQRTEGTTSRGWDGSSGTRAPTAPWPRSKGCQ